MNKNQKLAFGLLFIIFILFGIVSYNYAINKTDDLIKSKYNNTSIKYKNKISQLVNEKRKGTILVGIALSQNENIKEALLSNSSDCISLSRFVNLSQKHSGYKDIWIQIIDKKGNSFYRSWVDKKGDSLISSRKDIKELIKNPKVTSSISTGKFSMTFKSIIPIYDMRNKFIGAVEIITHFNSISNILIDENVKPIIIVDKKYKKQLTKAYTNTFVKNNYIANFNADKEILKELRKLNNIDFILNNNYYVLFKNYIVITHKVNDIDNRSMGYISIFIDKNNIDLTGISAIKNSIKTIIISIGMFLIFTALFLIIYIKSKNIEYINKQLEKNHPIKNSLNQ